MCELKTPDEQVKLFGWQGKKGTMARTQLTSERNTIAQEALASADLAQLRSLFASFSPAPGAWRDCLT